MKRLALVLVLMASPALAYAECTHVGDTTKNQEIAQLLCASSDAFTAVKLTDSRTDKGTEFSVLSVWLDSQGQGEALREQKESLAALADTFATGFSTEALNGKTLTYTAVFAPDLKYTVVVLKGKVARALWTE